MPSHGSRWRVFSLAHRRVKCVCGRVDLGFVFAAAEPRGALDHLIHFLKTLEELLMIRRPLGILTHQLAVEVVELRVHLPHQVRVVENARVLLRKHTRGGSVRHVSARRGGGRYDFSKKVKGGSVVNKTALMTSVLIMLELSAISALSFRRIALYSSTRPRTWGYPGSARVT